MNEFKPLDVVLNKDLCKYTSAHFGLSLEDAAHILEIAFRVRDKIAKVVTEGIKKQDDSACIVDYVTEVLNGDELKTMNEALFFCFVTGDMCRAIITNARSMQQTIQAVKEIPPINPNEKLPSAG